LRAILQFTVSVNYFISKFINDAALPDCMATHKEITRLFNCSAPNARISCINGVNLG